MARKGFSLIGGIIGIALLGLIAVTVLPIINSSFGRISEQKTKAEMIYIGESIIEKIKACELDHPTDVFVFNANIFDLLCSFKEMEDVEVNLSVQDDSLDYEIRIKKENKSNKLWIISVNVSEKGEGENHREVKYEALMPAW